MYITVINVEFIYESSLKPNTNMTENINKIIILKTVIYKSHIKEYLLEGFIILIFPKIFK